MMSAEGRFTFFGIMLQARVSAAEAGSVRFHGFPVENRTG